MKFIIFYIGLFISVLGAGEISLETPKDAVKSYYYAMNQADLATLKKVMVKDSYDETVQVWALSIALNDKEFHAVLKQYGTDPKIDEEVEAAVRKKLYAAPAKTISDLETTPLGKSRAIIRYKENDKKKQLFASLHDTLWKIDYMAGRKID